MGKFTSRSTTLKFANGFLGKILPACYIDGFQPTFFPPAPSSAWGHANLFKPFGKTNNRSGGWLSIEVNGIHMRTTARRGSLLDFV